MLFRLAGILGCAFLFVWTLGSLLMVVDLAVTGSVGWVPWVEAEALKPGEYLAGYTVMLLLGSVGSWIVWDWTRTMW
jgi:hypothetical protein